jgi:bacterial/archaeal transporter family-2 protein
LTLETLFLALLAMAMGTLFPIQAAANSQLGRLLGGPVAATTVSFTVGLLVLVVINAAVFRQFPRLSDVLAAPLWLLFIGGAIGAAFLSANVYIAPKLGAAATLCFVIAGQIASALLIDRLGLFAFDVRHLSLGRVAGALLVLAGAMLVRLT